MKYLYYFFILILFINCSSKTTNFEPSLLQAIDSLDTNAGVALDYLSKNISADTLNRQNKAFYYLLFTEATDKNGLDIFPCDSILDYSIKHLSKKKDPLLASKARFYKGKILAQMDNYDRATDYYTQALDLADKAKDTVMISKIHTYMGDLLLAQGLNAEAMEQYHLSYQLDLQTGNEEYLVISLMNIGMAKVYVAEYDSALFYLNDALKVVESNDSLAYLTDDIYNNLSICCIEMNDLPSAEQWVNRINSQSDEFSTNKGNYYLQVQQYDSARFYLEKGIESANIYSKAASYLGLAELEQKEGNYELSNNYLFTYIYI